MEELPISVYFQLEDFGWDEVKDLPGADEDFLCDFEDIACRLVEEHFRKACENLAPFLEKIKFNSISIGIDVIGIGSGIASYYHEMSDAEKGNYGFHISAEVLAEYLKKHYDSSYEIRPVTNYTWEHELIHLLDHKNLTEFRYANRSTDVREFLVHYLLSFRNEGIADLYHFLLNDRPVKSKEEARSKFLEDISRVESYDWENNDTIKENEWKLMQTYLFYSVGPWMILHILSCPEYKNMTPLAREVFNIIENEQEVDKYTKSEIIKHSILISNEDFIQFLSEPGLDGKCFIPMK